MTQSKPHWHPWIDDPDPDDHHLSDVEFRKFIEAYRRMVREKNRQLPPAVPPILPEEW